MWRVGSVLFSVPATRRKFDLVCGCYTDKKEEEGEEGEEGEEEEEGEEGEEGGEGGEGEEGEEGGERKGEEIY